jgi:phenylacetate-CoA ligase
MAGREIESLMGKIAARLWNTLYLISCLRGQARYPFKPLGTILRAQHRNVRRIVAYAYRHVPYYRETLDRLGLSPADFQTANDLAKLPVLDRELIQRDPLHFVSRERPLAQYLCVDTSGTSGRPLGVYHDSKDILRSVALPVRLQTILSRYVSRRFHYREVRIVTRISAARSIMAYQHEHTILPSNFPACRKELFFEDPMGGHLRVLQEFRPEILCSYGSYLERLFPPRTETEPLPAWLPRVVVYGAEMLDPCVRQRIERAYGVPVFSNYHAVEASRMGFECEQHRGLHINIDYYPIRIVDERARTVPCGEKGEVVVSNLSNRATVLLNYRLGDTAGWIDAPCPCGRNLPLLSFIKGRQNDHVILPSGKKIHAYVATNFMLALSGIVQYRLVQDALNHLTVMVVPTPSFDLDGLRSSLLAGFAAVMGPEIAVDIDFVGEIARTPGGKYRTVESKLHVQDHRN